MQKWEYKEVGYPHTSEKTLNDLGNEGWELVAIACDDMARIMKFIFKRPKK